MNSIGVGVKITLGLNWYQGEMYDRDVYEFWLTGDDTDSTASGYLRYNGGGTWTGLPYWRLPALDADGISIAEYLKTEGSDRFAGTFEDVKSQVEACIIAHFRSFGIVGEHVSINDTELLEFAGNAAS